jgi:hypothetical protein
MTDIDTAGIARVSLIRRDDLDQPGYNIVVSQDREREFERAFENAAGTWCLQMVMSGAGCHYNSKARHDVFVERKAPFTYQIYTSG